MAKRADPKCRQCGKAFPERPAADRKIEFCDECLAIAAAAYSGPAVTEPLPPLPTREPRFRTALERLRDALERH